jgi:hypothetical protein
MIMLDFALEYPSLRKSKGMAGPAENEKAHTEYGPKQ